MASIRTFIAVDVPPSVQIVCTRQIEHLCRLGADLRWVDPKKMHLTLRFLGNIRDTEAPELCQVVQKAVGQAEPVLLSIRGLGAFPNRGQPKVVWLGIADGLAELRQLRKRLDSGLQAMGFPTERNEFRPHLTLGRVGAGGLLGKEVFDWISRHEKTEFGGFEIDQLVVYSSFLDREGPTYTPMTTIDLDG